MKQLDKKGWKIVRFGDVCRNLNVTVKSPEENGYNKVIGLENIESGNLHIETWGDIAEGTTFTKTFKPGHVLFGKRRAYLKKAAVAEFKGLCSGDILVFEAIDKLLHPKLLPFIVSCDRFFEHAVKTSAGSLSPRTKFQDLANFEFSLPAIDQQEKLAELLWAGDEQLQNTYEIKRIIHTIKKIYFKSKIDSWANLQRIKLGNICRPRQWKTIPTSELTESGFLVYGGNGIIGRYKEYNHENPVIAIACRGEKCGAIHYTLPKSYVTGNSMCLDELNEEIVKPEFLFELLNFSDLSSLVSGSAQPQIIKSDVERYPIPSLSKIEQNEFVSKIQHFNDTIINAENKISCHTKVIQSLVNSIF